MMSLNVSMRSAAVYAPLLITMSMSCAIARSVGNPDRRPATTTSAAQRYSTAVLAMSMPHLAHQSASAHSARSLVRNILVDVLTVLKGFGVPVPTKLDRLGHPLPCGNAWLTSLLIDVLTAVSTPGDCLLAACDGVVHAWHVVSDHRTHRFGVPATRPHVAVDATWAVTRVDGDEVMRWI